MRKQNERESNYNAKQDNPWIIGQDSIAKANVQSWVKREPIPADGEMLKRELGGPRYIREALGL